jgi:hypothetical protein
MADSKRSEVGREAVKHTIWHFTGAPLLDAFKEKWKQALGATLPSIGALIASHLTGVNWWWVVVIACETFGLVWFFWNRDSGRSVPAAKRVSDGLEETRILSVAPDVLVLDYVDNGAIARVTLYNDGKETAQEARFGPLKVEYEKRLYSHVPIPAIPSKNSFFVTNLGFEAASPLFHFIRDSTPADAITSVDLFFKNPTGRGFIKEFVLVTGIDGSLVWQPKPVRLLEALVEPKA